MRCVHFSRSKSILKRNQKEVRYEFLFKKRSFLSIKTLNRDSIVVVEVFNVHILIHFLKIVCVISQDENYLEEEQASEEECYGRRCIANEHCCPGTVCVNMDGIIGNCLFAYGRKLGELCRRDADCESGLVCDTAASSGASVCRTPMVLAKQYAEDCNTSTDCDITRGLCCQLQRRHRQQARKVRKL